MKIKKVVALSNHTLQIIAEEVTGIFDIKPYLQYEAFEPLNKVSEFKKVSNGGYFVEWDCGADLSADTIEAHLVSVTPDIVS
jgi:hypothetical protein